MNGSRTGFRRKAKGAAMSEFGAAFAAFVIAVVLPCTNILCFLAAYSIDYALTWNTSQQVARATSLKRANRIVDDADRSIAESTLARALRLERAGKPAFELAVVSQNLKGEKRRLMSTLEPIELQVDRSNFIYEYRLTSKFRIRPVIDLSMVPLVGSIPVVGGATPVQVVVAHEIEHPECLEQEQEH